MWSRGNATGTATEVFVVSTERGTDQVFALVGDAERYAADIPGSRVSRHSLRRGLGEAIVVFDRHVVIDADGRTRSDRTTQLWRFADDCLVDMPTADVEYFFAADVNEWHVVGFGTDEAELETQMRESARCIGPLDARSLA